MLPSTARPASAAASASGDIQIFRWSSNKEIHPAFSLYIREQGLVYKERNIKGQEYIGRQYQFPIICIVYPQSHNKEAYLCGGIYLIGRLP